MSEEEGAVSQSISLVDRIRRSCAIREVLHETKGSTQSTSTVSLFSPSFSMLMTQDVPRTRIILAGRRVEHFEEKVLWSDISLIFIHRSTSDRLLKSTERLCVAREGVRNA